ncbi:MAG: hypothetical protein ACYCSB_09450 [bacterium]
MRKKKGRIIIYGDIFRNNAAAGEIFGNSAYDAEQDEYFIAFNTSDERNLVINKLCKNKISYREADLQPAWICLNIK